MGIDGLLEGQPLYTPFYYCDIYNVDRFYKHGYKTGICSGVCELVETLRTRSSVEI